jgi:membrane-associated phospholipid phosphatase
MTDRLYSRLLLAFLFTVIVAQALFALLPGLDLAVSRRFTDAGGAFAAGTGAVPLLNDILRSAMELMAVAILLAVLAGWLGRWLAGANLRCAAFVAVNLALAPGLIVNGLLKSHLGRARPVQVTEFGGTAQFTPAWQITDQCARNCSFSSGDVAVAATLVICALVLAWPHLRGWSKALGGLLGLGFVVAIALMRLALGRHFLSDTVFSGLIAAATALALYPLFGIGTARRALSLAELRAGLSRLCAGLRTAAKRIWAVAARTAGRGQA